MESLASSKTVVSVTVVLLGFAVATLLVVLVGRDPAGMYSAIIQTLTGWDLRRGVWNARYIGEWLVVSTPLVLCGLSMAFAARSGLFNIGAEGQYIVGLTVAQFVALYGPRVAFIHWGVAVCAAIAAGFVWGGIVGFLKAKYDVSEVVATIMMNYIAFFVSRFATMRIPGTNTYRTPNFPESARLGSSFLESLSNGSRLNHGFFLMLAAVIFFFIVMEKTRLGFSLRATGFNKDAARYSGIEVTSGTTISMAIAGAFAALAGAIVALGSFSYGRVLSGQDGYGFDGIAVALVGNSGAGGTLLAGLLFGMLKSAQPLMQARQIPKEITAIITGLVVVFISLRAAVGLFMDWRKKEAAKKEADKSEAAVHKLVKIGAAKNKKAVDR